ncbi:MAG TPA: prolipoprotein diacylglyceryl transferase, partial [Candidatus Omnitrophota bacterium]|nr:prolipoprotein diacylglyceryl transferase [Candidatus Omnitrophota bacterium]
DFPLQLLDAAFLLSIFIFLRFVFKKRFDGSVLVLYMALAAIERFFIEFFRGDDRQFYFSLSIFQWISIFIFLAGITIYFLITWKKRNS